MKGSDSLCNKVSNLLKEKQITISLLCVRLFRFSNSFLFLWFRFLQLYVYFMLCMLVINFVNYVFLLICLYIYVCNIYVSFFMYVQFCVFCSIVLFFVLFYV